MKNSDIKLGQRLNWKNDKYNYIAEVFEERGESFVRQIITGTKLQHLRIGEEDCETVKGFVSSSSNSFGKWRVLFGQESET